MTIDYSTYTWLKVEVDEDGVATITMNNPEQLNATTPEGLDEIHNRIYPDLERDESVKAIIITGAGRGFCAGADLSERLGSVPGGAAAVRSLCWPDRTLAFLPSPPSAPVLP